MEIKIKTEPVQYVVHNGVELNASRLLKHLDDMTWADRTTFRTNDKEDMAILDLIRKESDELTKEQGHFYHEHMMSDNSIRIEWNEDSEDLIDSLQQKIYRLLEQAEKNYQKGEHTT